MGTEENTHWYSGRDFNLANERDAVAAMTVLERFEIAAVTSISAWDPGGTRRRSRRGGVGSQGGICRENHELKARKYS